MKNLILKKFKPCVCDLGLVTQLLLEEASYYTKPVYENKYHVVDWLLANDDNRIIGIQVWNK